METEEEKYSIDFLVDIINSNITLDEDGKIKMYSIDEKFVEGLTSEEAQKKILDKMESLSKK